MGYLSHCIIINMQVIGCHFANDFSLSARYDDDSCCWIEIHNTHKVKHAQTFSAYAQTVVPPLKIILFILLNPLYLFFVFCFC